MSIIALALAEPGAAGPCAERPEAAVPAPDRPARVEVPLSEPRLVPVKPPAPPPAERKDRDEAARPADERPAVVDPPQRRGAESRP
jgi:hypothetical protein